MSATPRLVFATRNAGKVAELRQLLAVFAIEVVSLAELEMAVPEVVEDGETFTANAIKKARTVSLATGLPALADASGLEVAALSGAPGVYSARFAGEHASAEDNNDKLVHAMAAVPDDERGARFRSVLALVDVNGMLADNAITTDGTCEGLITRERRGTGGFGYDPLFYSPELGVSFAEADAEAKNRVSHRGRAMVRMKPHIARYFQLANGTDSG